MAKKNKKRDNRARAALTWGITLVPALLAAVTAFWNTKDQGFTANGNGSRKSKRSKGSKAANASA